MPEIDPFATRLGRLAPEIDVPASRELFERSRTTGPARSPHTWWLAAAAVALLVAGAVALWAVARDGDSEVVAPRPEPAIGARGVSWSWEIPTPDATPGFTLVEDSTTLAELLNAGPGPGGSVPLVDFRRWVVVAVALPLDECEQLGFKDYAVDAERGTWTLEIGPAVAGPPSSGILPNGAPGPAANDTECVPTGADEIVTVVHAVERADLAATAFDGEVRFVAGGVDDLVVPATAHADRDEQFAVTGVTPTSSPAGRIRVAQSADELPAAVAGGDLSPTSAAVDWDQSIVVVFDLPATDCPPDDLVGFDTTDGPDGPVWSPRFAASDRPDGCGTPAASLAYAVAIDRADLGDEVRFRTPDNAVGVTDLGVLIFPTDPTPPTDDASFGGPEPIGEWTDVRQSTDGRTLRLSFVGAPEFAAGDPCTIRYVPVASESGSTVQVLLFGERPTLPREVVEDETFQPIVCTAAGADRSVDVALAEPLGDRTIDGWNGPVPADASVLTPIQFTEVSLACTRGGPTLRLRYEAPGGVSFAVRVVDGGEVIGEGSTALAGGGSSAGIGFGLALPPGPAAFVEIVRGGEVDQTLVLPAEGEPGWADLSDCRSGLVVPNETIDAATPDLAVDDPGWRLLGSARDAVRDEFVRWAVDTDTYADLTSALDVEDAPPVDFADHYVAAFSIVWEACQPELAMDWDGGSTWTAIFSGSGEACDSSTNHFTALVELDRSASPEGVRLRSAADGSDEFVGSVEIDTRTGELILGGLDAAGPVVAACDDSGAPVMEVQIRSLVERRVGVTVYAEGAPLNGLAPFDVGPGTTRVAVPYLPELMLYPESDAGTHQLRFTAESPPAELIVAFDANGLPATFPDGCRPT